MAIERVKGHGLQVNRDTTTEEPTIGTCRCGWNTRQRTREQVREAYRQHLRLVSHGGPRHLGEIGETKSDVVN